MPERDLEAHLRRLIETIDIANVLTEPITTAIERLLAVSAASLDSEEASVLVRDGDQGDLRFLAATGRVADRLRGMKIPAGKGVAGFVLMSGQPMAVSDVEGESSFYAEVDKATGYDTKTMLALPLRAGDEVVGVLEYVNRRGDPPHTPFTADEMDRAGIYADAIAALVDSYYAARLLKELSSRVIGSAEAETTEQVRAWLGSIRDSSGHRERLDLALLVRELARRGDSERRLARELLESLLKYSDTMNETSYLGY